MPLNYGETLFNSGDRVTIKHGDFYGECEIVERRGSLGPGGGQVYLVRSLSRDQEIELREDQLELFVKAGVNGGDE